MTPTPTIGFIGVGLMGHGIVKNLVQKGQCVRFLDHPGNQPVDDLVTLGGVGAGSIADVMAGADVLFICVTGSPQVNAIVFDAGGVLENLKAGQTVCDLSTAMPDETVKVGAAIEAAGGRFLDTPMTRTPKEAEDGRLNIMAGGAAEVLAEVRPLLDCFAENVFHAGAVGSGIAMKLLHNFISLGYSALMAEAVAAARLGGVDMQTFLDVMETGGGRGVVLDRLKPFIATGDVGAFQFSIANSAKDMGYYVDMASKLGAEADCADAVATLYGRAVRDGHGGKPVPVLMDVLGDGDGD